MEKARRGSPFFQKLYADLPPTSEIKLSDLPVARKPDLMRAFDEWLTIRSLPLERARAHLRHIGNAGVPINDVAVFQTSGTSGEPAVIVLPSSFLEYYYGITMARFERYHWRLIREVRKLGVRVTITGGNGHFARNGRNKLMQRLNPALAKGLGLTFIEAEQPIDRLVDALNAIPNVAWIVTYPSMLAILAREKEAGRLRIAPALFSAGGENLTEDLRAKALRAYPSLRYGIADFYGCTECLALAFTCSHGRKHLNENWVILEAVDEAFQPVPDGMLSATVLLTVLANEVQPFIRYDLGDCVRFHQDACRGTGKPGGAGIHRERKVPRRCSLARRRCTKHGMTRFRRLELTTRWVPPGSFQPTFSSCAA